MVALFTTLGENIPIFKRIKTLEPRTEGFVSRWHHTLRDSDWFIFIIFSPQDALQMDLPADHGDVPHGHVSRVDRGRGHLH